MYSIVQMNLMMTTDTVAEEYDPYSLLIWDSTIQTSVNVIVTISSTSELIKFFFKYVKLNIRVYFFKS